MQIRKYWLDDEYFIYAIDDPDDGCTNFWVGRKNTGELSYAFGTDMSQVAGEEEDFVNTLYMNNFFRYELDDLAQIV